MPETAFTSDEVPIAYDTCGSGPLLVFVHGLGDQCSIWARLVEQLAPAYRCVALDLRGHGDSGQAEDYEAFGLARDVEAVLTAVDANAAVLIGHSLGGFVASVAAAADARVRAVVNIDQPLALADLGSAVRAMGDTLAHAPVADILMDVLAQLGFGSLSSAEREALRATRVRLPRSVLLGAWAPLLANDDRALDARLNALLARVTGPYLSLHGCTPPHEYRAWLSARVPQAEYVHWPDAGHFPHVDRAAALATLLRDWLMQHRLDRA